MPVIRNFFNTHHYRKNDFTVTNVRYCIINKKLISFSTELSVQNIYEIIALIKCLNAKDKCRTKIWQPKKSYACDKYDISKCRAALCKAMKAG